MIFTKALLADLSALEQIRENSGRLPCASRTAIDELFQTDPSATSKIDMLASVCRNLGATMDVMVRCTPGVDPNTHKFISTGQADTKFGLNIKVVVKPRDAHEPTQTLSQDSATRQESIPEFL